MAVHAKKEVKKEKMTPGRFIEEFYPALKRIDDGFDMDVSWQDGQAFMLHDIRIPNAIRRRIVYTKQEIEDGVHEIVGDFERRVRRLMGV